MFTTILSIVLFLSPAETDAPDTYQCTPNDTSAPEGDWTCVPDDNGLPSSSSCKPKGWGPGTWDNALALWCTYGSQAPGCIMCRVGVGCWKTSNDSCGM